MPDRPAHLIIGEVLRPHGVKGELRIRLLTDYPERIATLHTVVLGRDIATGTRRTYRLLGMRRNAEYGLLRLEGIDSREAADRLRQLLVMIPIEDAVPLEPGEFYLFQLIGLRVLTEEGRMLGELVEVLETGANDVYVVRPPAGPDILIPVIEGVVLRTDIDAGELIVRPPEGLLTPEPDDDERD
jgi:16S rRNA processing protein RimM